MRAREQRARAFARAAAEQLHKDAGVPLTVCVAADPDNDVIVAGAWCPSAEVLATILRTVADRIDQGTATIVDRRTEPRS